MSRSMTQVMQVLEAVRRLEAGARGAATGQLRSFMSEHHGVSAPQCKKLLRRAVTEGFLLRKSNKFYFVPSNNVALPALAVIRRRRRGGKRSRRSRSGRRYATLAGTRGLASRKIRICSRRSIDLVNLGRNKTSRRRSRNNREQTGTTASNTQEHKNNTASPRDNNNNINYIA